MYLIALPIISIVCCFAYIFFIVLKYGIPVSISETYYILPVKWDWLFSAWTVLTAMPFGIYWFNTAPDNLKWIPITVAIALLMIGVADCYKSGPKSEKNYNPSIISGADIVNTRLKHSVDEDGFVRFWISEESFKEFIKRLNIKDFFKYGLARFLHYTNSLLAIILSTIYICMTAGTPAIILTVLSYVVFIIIGSKVDGVYNMDYSLDYNNKAWIFFMECVCFINLFVFTVI